MAFADISSRLMLLRFQGMLFSLPIFSVVLLLHSSSPSVAQQVDIVVDEAASPPQNQYWSQYVLDAGDQISIDVFRVPQYSGEYEVLTGGLLFLPMIGQISVRGLTIDQASATIARAYASRLRRPIVNVTLLSPRPLRIGMAGEVSQPGIYTMQREGTQFPSLVDALSVAGGITQSADFRRIIIRRSISGNSEETLVSNLQDFLDTGNLDQDLFLRDGDSIFVPSNEQFDRHEAWQIASANFSTDENTTLNIAVIGEVFRPGPYTVSGNARTGEAGDVGRGQSAEEIAPTVTRAIQLAGGITPSANIQNIKVYRRTRSGQKQTIDVNLWRLLQDGDLTEDIVLQEGDTIEVAQSNDLTPNEVAEIVTSSFAPDTIEVNIVGEVDRPGRVQVSPNTPLSQGVLAAGGFNNRATRRAVELIRLNPDGTATKTSIEVDFSVGIDPARNPLLQNNDIVVVRRSGSARVSDTLETVTAPLSRAFSIFALPSTILRLFD
ncbi:MAG: SLBB domain-containing protein [Cyanobacteria bacterium P01_D01_bin.156]